MTCDFSGYLPASYTITWTGPQGAALTNGGRHTISVGNGVGLSQSGGSSPGPSVLSTINISTVEEMDLGIYNCTLVGDNNAQITGSVELNVIVMYTTTSSSLPVSPSFSGICKLDLYNE